MDSAVTQLRGFGAAAIRNVHIDIGTQLYVNYRSILFKSVFQVRLQLDSAVTAAQLH